MRNDGFTNIVHNLGDALQGGDDPPVQGVGQQQGDERGEQNAAGQYQNRDTEKVADQFIKRGQSQLADLFALVPDGLHRGLRKQPLTDKAAHLFFVGQRFMAPCGEVLLLAVEHNRLGICPCFPSEARVSSAAALSPNTRAASRLRPMVAAVSSRFSARTA